MQYTKNPGKPGTWIVLLLICVATVGCGIVAAQDNGQGFHSLPSPAYSERWNEVASVCKGEADLAVPACQDECQAKYSKDLQEYVYYSSLVQGPHTLAPPYPDVIGLLFCYGWCDKNVWLPAFQSCLKKNNCEPAPM